MNRGLKNSFLLMLLSLGMVSCGSNPTTTPPLPTAPTTNNNTNVGGLTGTLVQPGGTPLNFVPNIAPYMATMAKNLGIYGQASIIDQRSSDYIPQTVYGANGMPTVILNPVTAIIQEPIQTPTYTVQATAMGPSMQIRFTEAYGRTTNFTFARQINVQAVPGLVLYSTDSVAIFTANDNINQLILMIPYQGQNPPMEWYAISGNGYSQPPLVHVSRKYLNSSFLYQYQTQVGYNGTGF